MKRFRFSLEPVRRWRQEQARVEEMTLERLREERSARRRALSALEVRTRNEAESVLKGGVLDASSLGSLDAYRKYARKEAERMRADLEQWERRIAGQQARVLEARRQARLLDRLYERSLHQWKTDADREQEQLVADLFLARLGAKKR